MTEKIERVQNVCLRNKLLIKQNTVTTIME